MNLSNTFVITILFMIGNTSFASNSGCELQEVGPDYDKNYPTCLFYTGTAHYRAKRYLEASKKWEKILALPSIPKEYTELFVSSHNNLGYLYFFGLGVREDKKKGLSHWMSAVSMGHSESEYHLCHAYGNPKVETYDPYKAYPHCTKAEKIYEDKKDKDGKVILDLIRKYKAIVKKDINA